MYYHPPHLHHHSCLRGLTEGFSSGQILNHHLLFFCMEKYFGHSPYWILFLFLWTSFSLLLSSIFFLLSSLSFSSLSRPCSSTTTAMFSFDNWLRTLKSRSSRAFFFCNFSLSFSSSLAACFSSLLLPFVVTDKCSFFFPLGCFFVTSGEFSFFFPLDFFCFSLQESFPSFFHLVVFLQLCPWHFSSLTTHLCLLLQGEKNQVTSSKHLIKWYFFCERQRSSFHVNCEMAFCSSWNETWFG